MLCPRNELAWNFVCALEVLCVVLSRLLRVSVCLSLLRGPQDAMGLAKVLQSGRDISAKHGARWKVLATMVCTAGRAGAGAGAGAGAVGLCVWGRELSECV